METPIWYKQSGFRFEEDERVMYIDPWEIPAGGPKADFILITHAHGDHFDRDAIARLRKPSTVIVAPTDVASDIFGENVIAVSPNERRNIEGLVIETVPAYNIDKPFHPKAQGWVGYLITVGGTTFYHAGDTDRIPEMDELRTDVAMLPIGGTYTMDAVEAAEATRAIAPKLAIPMHYGFVVGNPRDAERFQKLAPVTVAILKPQLPFSR